MPRLKGKAELKIRLRQIERAVQAAMEQKLDEQADDALEQSHALAPQLTAEMIDTSGVRKIRVGRDRFRRIIFYTVPYAPIQHEGFFNPGPVTRSKPGAGRKFLLRAMAQNRARYVREMGRTIERAVRRVVR